MSDQRGFSLIEGLLVLIAFTMIGFTGFYVYNSTKAAKRTDNRGNQAVASNDVKKSDNDTKTEQSDTWFLYTPPEKQYSVRLADGWNLIRYQQQSSLYTLNNDNLALKPGTNATVTEADSGRDGTGGFFLTFYTEQTGPYVYEGSVRQRDLKTNDGLTIEKYEYIETSPKPEGLGQLNQSGVYYNYAIKGAADKYITAIYSVQPGDTHHFKIIEEVLRTIKFN